MFFFRAGIIAAMLIGLAAPVGQSWAQQAWAQYYPPRAYPAPQGSLNQPIPLDPDRASRDPVAPPDAPGSTHIDSRNVDSRNMVALPPEVRPETGPRKELPPQFRRTLVDYYTKEPAGTIIVDTPNTYLYLVLGQGKALRYGIGVGREGFTWSGAERISRKAEWPDWNPPEQMIERQPYLPRFMAGGDGNPLGARALISVTPSIAFTAPISRPPSGPSSPRAASGSPTRTSRTCTPASRSARAWWCCRAGGRRPP